MPDRDWSIEGDGGEPLHVYARGLDRRVAIRASGPVVLDADGLAKVIEELTERLLIMSGRSGLRVMLDEIRTLWDAGQGNEMAAVAMALLTSLSVVEATLMSERAEHAAKRTQEEAERELGYAIKVERGECEDTPEGRWRAGLRGEALSAIDRADREHAATLAELGPPPVVDGRVLGGREAARAFRQELDRARAAEAELRRRVMAAIDVLEASYLDSDSARRCSNTILRAG